MGEDEENNYILVHDYCNRNKLDSDLRVTRCMARYEKIKESYMNLGSNRPNLKNFLKEFDRAKYLLRIKKVKNNFLEYSIDEFILSR